MRWISVPTLPTTFTGVRFDKIRECNSQLHFSRTDSLQFFPWPRKIVKIHIFSLHLASDKLKGLEMFFSDDRRVVEGTHGCTIKVGNTIAEPTKQRSLLYLRARSIHFYLHGRGPLS
jgi:hypothetical protein